ncbi:hypothetical protein FXO38_22585 [Capsicum annuum]|nr:hypothetical protein FXO38_22585 [Capsicum annuum]KAF3642788.1 hypothetical protein FXO37_22348 [Capsicum annuum]
MAQAETGSKGQKICLLTNHFKIGMTIWELFPLSCKLSTAHTTLQFHSAKVALSYDDGNPVEVNGIGQKILYKVHQTYAMELARKDFAYNEENNMFIIGLLPGNKFEFDVVLVDTSSSRTILGSPGGSLDDDDPKRLKTQPWSKAYKVVIKGCLIVHQTFFHNKPRNFIGLGGGV